MIRRRVSVALLVRDGFTGLPLTSGAEMLCDLDQQMVRPVFKEGGYLVLTDLPNGVHTLTLRRRGFLPEVLTLTIRDGEFLEETVSLRPGPDYPFRTEPVRLRVSLESGSSPLREEDLWIGVTGPAQLKLAQNKDEPRGTRVRLFCKGNPSGLPVPGWFLLADKTGAELVHLRVLNGEAGELDVPMAHVHSRGIELIPMWRYRSDEKGEVHVLFRQEGTASLFCREQWKTISLQQGVQDLTWKLEE